MRSGNSCMPPIARRSSRIIHINVTPVGDDRPFFFYTVQPRDIRNFLKHADTKNADFKINRAVPLLFDLMLVSILATAIDPGASAAGAAQPASGSERSVRDSCGIFCASARATF